MGSAHKMKRLGEKAKKATRRDPNLMFPTTPVAVGSFATLGEIRGVLKEIFGECKTG